MIWIEQKKKNWVFLTLDIRRIITKNKIGKIPENLQYTQIMLKYTIMLFSSGLLFEAIKHIQEILNKLQ